MHSVDLMSFNFIMSFNIYILLFIQNLIPLSSIRFSNRPRTPGNNIQYLNSIEHRKVNLTYLYKHLILPNDNGKLSSKVLEFEICSKRAPRTLMAEKLFGVDWRAWLNDTSRESQRWNRSLLVKTLHMNEIL